MKINIKVPHGGYCFYVGFACQVRYSVKHIAVFTLLNRPPRIQ